MDKINPQLPLLTDSSQTDLNSVQNRDHWLLSKARQIFSCYRRADANDPDGYCAAVAAILSEYNQDVIERVVDPRTGIARKVSWIPSIAEISKECDEISRQIASEKSAAAFQERRKATPRPYTPPTFEPNLFVPQLVSAYPRMAARAQLEPKRARFEAGGVWVPLNWYYENGDGTPTVGQYASRQV